MYFPDAIAEVAKLSKAGNDQHNPGQPLHWSRDKSADHHDCAARHLIESGTVDPLDGQRHSAKLAWRALAILQLELEREAEKLNQEALLEEQLAVARASRDLLRAQYAPTKDTPTVRKAD